MGSGRPRARQGRLCAYRVRNVGSHWNSQVCGWLHGISPERSGPQRTSRAITYVSNWLNKFIHCLRQPQATKTLGLALGGGGVRGMAHIGVLTVLQKAGIPIYAIAGTSMGAIVGAAFGLSPEFDKDHLVRQVMDLDFKPALPLGVSEKDREGFFEHVRRFLDVERFLIDAMWGWGPFERKIVADAMDRLTLGKSLEESRIPLAIVAADLLSGEEVVFRKGPASFALQASSALPGFFPPVKQGERLLVDGAFVDLVPVDVVRTMGTSVVVAVDVDQGAAQGDISNGLQAFLRSVEIGARHHKRLHLKMADLVIHPEFGEHVDSFDFSKATLCVEAGVQAAERAVPKLLQLMNLD